MVWARDEVLIRAQHGSLGMRAVYNLVYRAETDRSPEALRVATVALVNGLAADGLVEVGDRTAAGFVPWGDAVGDRLENLDFGASSDPPLLRLTDAGRQAAQAVPVADADIETGPSDKKWDWPLPVAAREVLLYGTTDWVELGQIHWRVKEVSPGAAAQVLQRRTLELIADLVVGDLAQVGSFDRAAFGFVPWDSSLEETLQRIRSVFVDSYDDADTWEWYCMLELTRRGDFVARIMKARTADPP